MPANGRRGLIRRLKFNHLNKRAAEKKCLLLNQVSFSTRILEKFGILFVVFYFRLPGQLVRIYGPFRGSYPTRFPPESCADLSLVPNHHSTTDSKLQFL